MQSSKKSGLPDLQENLKEEECVAACEKNPKCKSINFKRDTFYSGNCYLFDFNIEDTKLVGSNTRILLRPDQEVLRSTSFNDWAHIHCRGREEGLTPNAHQAAKNKKRLSEKGQEWSPPSPYQYTCDGRPYFHTKLQNFVADDFLKEHKNFSFGDCRQACGDDLSCMSFAHAEESKWCILLPMNMESRKLDADYNWTWFECLNRRSDALR